MHDPHEMDAKAFFDTYFVQLYPGMVALLRTRYRVRMSESVASDSLDNPDGDVKVASAFLTTFSHFRRGEFNGLSPVQLVAAYAHIVFNRWRRSDRARDRRHVSYSAPPGSGARSTFEPSVNHGTPEAAAQLLDYFREIDGEVDGRLTADNPKYREVIRAYLEEPGTQAEIARRCGCKQATVSRALRWLEDTIDELGRHADGNPDDTPR